LGSARYSAIDRINIQNITKLTQYEADHRLSGRRWGRELGQRLSGLEARIFLLNAKADGAMARMIKLGDANPPATKDGLGEDVGANAYIGTGVRVAGSDRAFNKGGSVAFCSWARAAIGAFTLTNRRADNWRGK
jgi:hypothetical protein